MSAGVHCRRWRLLAQLVTQPPAPKRNSARRGGGQQAGQCALAGNGQNMGRMPRAGRYSPYMLTATWVLAAATSVLALASLVAVVTWRENKRRERETALADKILDTGRKEFGAAFATKESLSQAKDTMDNRTGLAVVAVLIAAALLWDKLSGVRLAGRD